MAIKKYYIKTETYWCGEDKEYVAICDEKYYSELEELVASTAYDTFLEFGGPDGVLEEMFGFLDDEKIEYDGVEEDEAENCHGDYYFWSIEEFDESHGEWEWFEVLYDNTD
jgi:hypothetical protein